jgi:hypothetical protein
MTDTAATPEADDPLTAPGSAAEASPAPVTTPETPTATTAEPVKQSLADIVNQVLDKGEETTAAADDGASPAPQDDQTKDAGSADAPSAAAAEASQGDPEKQGSEAADDGDLPPAEMKALPAKTQRRIKRLLEDRGRFKESHEAYGNITSYMAENSLSGQEVAIGFDMMAKLKRGDAAGFLKAIEPYVKNARLAVGEDLPDDLRQRVDAGYTDEDTAKELARERAKAAAAANAVREREGRDQAAHAAVQASALRETLNSWDRANASDPDFAAARPALLEFAKVSFAAQPPKSPDEAVKRLGDYWNLIRRRAPASPRPVASSPSSQQSTGRSMIRQPKTLEDAISIGFERAAQRGTGATF